MKKSELRNIIRSVIKEQFTSSQIQSWINAFQTANWPCDQSQWSNFNNWTINFHNLVDSVAINNGFTGTSNLDMEAWSQNNPQPCNMIEQKIYNWYSTAASGAIASAFGTPGFWCNPNYVGSSWCNQLACKVKFGSLTFAIWGCTP